MALGAVDQHVLQAELLADADAGGHVVGTVGVDVDRQFPPDHRQKGLQLGVVVGLVLLLVLCRPLQLLPVLHRLGQVFPDDGGGGHAGGGGLMPLVIGELGVLPQGQLHGRRGLEDHLIHPAAVGFQGGELAADGVGAPRAGEDGGHPRLPGLLKAPVHGVDGVHRPQVGGAGVGGLVAVVPLNAGGVPEHPQVAVGIHKAGLDVSPLGVEDLPLPALGTLLHGAGPGDLVPPDIHIASGDGEALHGVDGAVDNQHSVFLSRKAADIRQASR